MHNLDLALTQSINGLSGRFPLLDAAMIDLSAFGVPLLVLAVALQWWRGPDRLHIRHVLVATGLTFVLGLTLNQVIVHLFHRTRPYDAGVTHLLIARSADFSFPSDHATASVAIAASLLMHGMRRTGLIFALAALLLCFSRVYIGTHYFSDILGGSATAILAALLIPSLYQEGTRIDQLITKIL
ncbi:MAG: phosphatase PAP2 family protein [Paracoccaceae bacterium]|nr:phosphatase PAP2 family protein [Paracoccaceae bacterium]